MSQFVYVVFCLKYERCAQPAQEVGGYRRSGMPHDVQVPELVRIHKTLDGAFAGLGSPVRAGSLSPGAAESWVNENAPDGLRYRIDKVEVSS